MDIGIGLPNAVPGIDRRGIVEWARLAEDAGFSTLATLDRIAYGNYEPLVSLAAAAAVTERIRLMTDILILPLRANTALFAKQTATLDSLSGGRLVLGLAVGGREDDYELSRVEFRRRGATFERQLQELLDLWSGDPVGPKPAGGKRPTILIGGQSDAAFRRAVQYADGWTLGGGTPEALAGGLEKLRAAWSAAGREGEPRNAALMYFSLGEDAREQAESSLGDYYAFLGEYAQRIVDGAAKDPEEIKQRLAAFEAAGADEVICFPASADPAQVELLAEAALPR